MKAKKKDASLAGVYGRLGDLGTIDMKYDVAVTTACGALDNIVVDTTETAQKCIEILREKNLGRARFIIMDKMRSFEAQTRAPSKAPDGFPRLFDLIKPKEEMFACAFYFGVRETLVADNLDHAVK